ncbi:polymer-forming cytoskeletal protein [Uliginosibacterium sp. 31-16]|uniref:bactofilin family protein n=1 Tax=Uliginosibacterium sp. 31-16 TaxID=3068315 RepID=UPI00273F2722|nr:polymer-forming cytoskeletal protein [Uliginosibacterium sp. 31-16]MDP5239634.1 polymer-forming cytoskeletal protein [Uliginosibacterium sp. 31-16]
MFHKALPRTPEPAPERQPQPRVTHTPGAYPPLGRSRDTSALNATQAAQLLATQPIAPAETTMPVSHATTPEHESPSRLVVGPDVKLKGAEIQDCDTLIVEGRVEATMDSRVLRITEKGAFSGKVGIDVAEIHGQFEGELTVREKLVIHATGRVKGTIRYGSILIEAGGQICGDVQALEQARSGELRNPGKEVERSKVTSLITSVA